MKSLVKTGACFGTAHRAAAIAFCVAANTAAAQWEVRNLHPAGATYSFATAVSDGPQVAGYVTFNAAAGEDRACWWPEATATSWVNLHPAGSTRSYVYGIDGGRQAGYATFGSLGSDSPRAGLWDGTSMSWISWNPSGVPYSGIRGSGGGTHAGSVWSNGRTRAAMWNGDGTSWTDLAANLTLTSEALATDGAQQVGYSWVNGATAIHAALWNGTAATYVDLNPTLNGIPATSSNAYGVHGGEQVGRVSTGGWRAALWRSSAASYTDLNPVDATTSEAYGTHNGEQVGVAVVNGTTRASWWAGSAASWVDLHALIPSNAGYTGSRAVGIWHEGATTYIIGQGSVGGSPGRLEALLWIHTAVPADSDGDGLSDPQETGTYGTNPNSPDTDADGLDDGDEVTRGTNPVLQDSDLDGLADGVEVTMAGSIGCPDPMTADSDQDGIVDGTEASGSLDPCDQDTDGDGLSDGAEAAASQSSGCPSALVADSDGDGRHDGAEVGYGTDPCVPDSGDAWIFVLDTANGDFHWTSDFPLPGSGPWALNVTVSEARVEFAGTAGIIGGLIQSLTQGVFDDVFERQFVVPALPAGLVSQRFVLSHADETVFEGDLVLGIDAQGFGQLHLTNVVHGQVQVQLFGGVPVFESMPVESVSGLFRVEFAPVEDFSDCNVNGLPDTEDIASGRSSDRDRNGVPDDCDPDTDSDGVPNSVDNCPDWANADQVDSDQDGRGDPCDSDWTFVLDTANGDFHWTSAFPLTGSGPWTLNTIVSEVAVELSGTAGAIVGMIQPLFQGALNFAFDQPFVARTLPTSFGSQPLAVPFEGEIVFAGDLSFWIDEQGFGHVDLTNVVHGQVQVPSQNPIPLPLPVSVPVESVSGLVRIVIGELIDCNANGLPDSADIASGRSADLDGNSVPDDCDPDADSDGVPNSVDNCPIRANADQVDSDQDGQGDVCDLDWTFVVDTANGDYHSTSEFPLGGPGSWMLIVELSEFQIELEGVAGAIAGLAQTLTHDLYDGIVNDALRVPGSDEILVPGAPAELFSTAIVLQYENALVFSGTLIGRIDAQGFGHVELSQIVHGHVVAPLIGSFAVESLSVRMRFAFAPQAMNDFDGDGLSDADELSRGTSVFDPDCDDDGLSDGAEVALTTDPLDVDTDDDGLQDGLEVELAAFGGCPSPLVADSDNDGISDSIEELVAPMLDPCDWDYDNDGLADGLEATYGTNPTNDDTDGDGLLDGTEVDMAQAGLCPSPTNPDSDGDLLSDGSEASGGSSPCNPDSDGDGVRDDADPTPTAPGVTSGFMEVAARDLSTDVLIIDLGEFTGPNANANTGRRNSMANRLTNAANAIAAGDEATALTELQSLLDRVDGETPPPDWMEDSPQKAQLAADVRLLIALLGY